MAVIIELADPAKVSPLVISAFTVQQHIRNIFDKTGVRSRRDLGTTIFFAHDEPRLRDNDKRAAADRPCGAGRVRNRPPTDFVSWALGAMHIIVS